MTLAARVPASDRVAAAVDGLLARGTVRLADRAALESAVASAVDLAVEDALAARRRPVELRSPVLRRRSA